MTQGTPCCQRMGELDQRMPGFLHIQSQAQNQDQKVPTVGFQLQKIPEKTKRIDALTAADQWLLVTGWRKDCKQTGGILCDENVSADFDGGYIVYMTRAYVKIDQTTWVHIIA